MYILIIVLMLIIIGIVIFIISYKSTNNEDVKKDKYPEGYYKSKGLAIGIGIGYLGAFLILLLIDKMEYFIYIAPTTGILIGLVIGYKMESKNKDKLRPLTENERKMKNYLKTFLLIVLVLGLITFYFTIN